MFLLVVMATLSSTVAVFQLIVLLLQGAFWFWGMQWSSVSISNRHTVVLESKAITVEATRSLNHSKGGMLPVLASRFTTFLTMEKQQLP